MLSEEDKKEVQKMIRKAVEPLQIDILEKKIKALE
jgi:hypothetical protein